MHQCAVTTNFTKIKCSKKKSSKKIKLTRFYTIVIFFYIFIYFPQIAGIVLSSGNKNLKCQFLVINLM